MRFDAEPAPGFDLNYPHPNGYVQIGHFYDGCSAHLGRTTNGVTNLNIGPGCDTMVIWVHEIGHVVGLHHEHSRTDRDHHINVLWQNVQPAYYSSFQKYIKKGWVNGKDLGPYDHTSVMHYDSWAFSVAPGDWNAVTLTRKDGSTFSQGPYGGLSPGDVQGVGKLYGIW